MPENEFNYAGYLRLKDLLGCQHPESKEHNNEVHDETLFIIVHQVYELWFKQVKHELDSIIMLLSPEKGVNDSNEIQQIASRLKRCTEIWRHLINQFTILETMAPGDFFDFRGYLTPASGFQSLQFKEILSKMGLRPQDLHYKHTNTGGLTGEDRKKLDDLEQEGAENNLLRLTDRWLKRMPFLNMDKTAVYWPGYANSGTPAVHPFLAIYKEAYKESIKSDKNVNDLMDQFEELFVEKGTSSFSHESMASALFIMVYRHYPIFHLPFDILNSITELDELISNWLYRHFTMVRRMIGMRQGTGQTPGAKYLEESLKLTQVFKDLTLLPTFMMEKSKLPALPQRLADELNFKYYTK